MTRWSATWNFCWPSTNFTLLFRNIMLELPSSSIPTGNSICSQALLKAFVPVFLLFSNCCSPQFLKFQALWEGLLPLLFQTWALLEPLCFMLPSVKAPQFLGSAGEFCHSQTDGLQTGNGQQLGFGLLLTSSNWKPFTKHCLMKLNRECESPRR